MADYNALLQPLTIKSLTLRNRVMSSSHGPGYDFFFQRPRVDLAKDRRTAGLARRL